MSLVGQTLAHYRILEKLGEGGMGVVYKAEDLKLTRTVALKFLPHTLQANEPERARFLQEARAAAILNHPNICTIHDIQEEDGQQFIVMEYVEGRTMRAASPIEKLQDALAYAIGIGEALQEAHSRGIVHRDIKTENIMLNARNQVKVMDFGLAKLKGSLKLAHSSSTVGTLAYMAPEQLHGGEVDARSDIFSFGAVLFEMLTGRTPFKGEHEAAVMYSIVNEPPESLLKHRPDLPAELEHVIDRALEKDPEDRYQHMDDMVSELRRINRQSARISRVSKTNLPILEAARASSPQQKTTVSKPAQPSHRRSLMIGGASLGVALIVIAAYFLFAPAHKSIDSLAVLPFVNASADPTTEYLSDGITESLINSLSRLSNLTVMSRSSVFHYKGKDSDPQAVGRELGVKAVLAGRLTQRGDNLTINAELVDVSNNSHIWGDRYDRKVSDLLSVQDDIAREISKNLSITLGAEERKQLQRGSTGNVEAYQLYLKGTFHWNKRKADDLHKAIDYYRQAIEKDPSYARAYAGLATAYVLLPEYAGASAKDVIPEIETAARKAIELDPTLAEPHAVLGLMKKEFQWDWNGAESEFKRAIELNPNYPTIYHWHCISLRQQGKTEQALTAIRRAQELDPLSAIICVNFGEVYVAMRSYDQAEEQYKKALELDPNLPIGHMDLGMLYIARGRIAEAINEMKKVREIVGPDDRYGLENLGYAYARAGEKSEALNILKQLLAASKQGSSVSVEIATVYTGLNDREQALRWLERAYGEQDELLGYIKIQPQWDNLRSEPRFIALLKRLGLEA
jgi:serine/threonine-protein kinase